MQAKKAFETAADTYFMANDAASYDDWKRARAHWNYFCKCPLLTLVLPVALCCLTYLCGFFFEYLFLSLREIESFSIAHFNFHSLSFTASLLCVPAVFLCLTKSFLSFC
jgi:hypothetical protein